MNVAPGGGMKSFWMYQFGGANHSLIENTKLHSIYQGNITEAGLIGSSTLDGGDTVSLPGDAEIFSDSIFFTEEFSALSAMMKSSHSRQLDSALLTALDRGFVNKKLGSMGKERIQYRTNFTLDAGTQPDRYDLSGGMARRFMFTVFIPTKADNLRLRKARREMRNIQLDPKTLQFIRRAVDKRVKEINKIKYIHFHDEADDFVSPDEAQHFELALFDKMVVGRHVMLESPGKVLEIRFDEIDLGMIKQQIKWRDQVSFGTHYLQVLVVINDEGGTATKESIIRQMNRYGSDPKRTMTLCRELKDFGMVKETKRKGIENFVLVNNL